MLSEAFHLSELEGFTVSKITLCHRSFSHNLTLLPYAPCKVHLIFRSWRQGLDTHIFMIEQSMTKDFTFTYWLNHFLVQDIFIYYMKYNLSINWIWSTHSIDQKKPHWGAKFPCSLTMLPCTSCKVKLTFRSWRQGGYADFWHLWWSL